MTREDLLERFDHHEAFIDKEMPFVNEQVALAEDDGGCPCTLAGSRD